MIQVNLIPLEEMRRAGQRRADWFRGLGAAGLTMLILLALTWLEWQTESGLRARRDTLELTAATYAADTTRAEDLQKQIDARRKMVFLLETIGAQEGSHEGVLSDVAQALPDPVWLSRFAITKDTLILEGRTTDQAMITRLLRNLAAVYHLAENELVEVHEVPGNANKRFSIRSRVSSAATREK